MNWTSIPNCDIEHPSSIPQRHFAVVRLTSKRESARATVENLCRRVRYDADSDNGSRIICFSYNTDEHCILMSRTKTQTSEKRQPVSISLLTAILLGFVLVILTQPQQASAQILPPNTYQLFLHSDPGTPWSRTTSRSWFYQHDDGQFVCLGYDWIGNGPLNHLTFFLYGNNGDFWQMAFTTPGELTPGNYEATINGRPGLDVGGLGAGCVSTSYGRFSVSDVAYEGSGNFIRMTRFAAGFEFHCNGFPPALIGSIFFNSNGFPPPPTLVMKARPPLSDATVGASYSERIEAEGGTPPYLWGINTGELPPGLSLDQNGVISGSPTSRGRYSFSIALFDSAPTINGYPMQTVISNFSIVVNPEGFIIEDGLPPTAFVGSEYSYQFAAVNGVQPYQWGIVEGVLPSGIRLATDGMLSGKPTSAGISTFTLRANDASGHQADKTYTIKVIDPPVIADAVYKVRKGKLVISGEKFNDSAKLLIDGVEIKPKSQDSASFVVKALTLSRGPHELRVVNPDGGTASVTINVE